MKTQVVHKKMKKLDKQLEDLESSIIKSQPVLTVKQETLEEKDIKQDNIRHKSLQGDR